MVHLLNPIPPTALTFRTVNIRTRSSTEENHPTHNRNHGTTSSASVAEQNILNDAHHASGSASEMSRTDLGAKSSHSADVTSGEADVRKKSHSEIVFGKGIDDPSDLRIGAAAAASRHHATPTPRGSLHPTPRTAMTPRKTPRATPTQVTPRKSIVGILSSEDPPILPEQISKDSEENEISAEDPARRGSIHDGSLRSAKTKALAAGTLSSEYIPRSTRDRKQTGSHESHLQFEPKDTIVDYARKGESEKVRELLRNKKLRAKETGHRELLSEALNESDERGWTALHWSAECDEAVCGRAMAQKRREVMRVLLEYREEGLDLHARANSGDTPLSQAVRCGNMEGCKLLLKKGADPNVQTEYGWTALHWAVNGHRAPRAVTCAQAVKPMAEMVQLLLRRAYLAHVDAPSDAGDTPLHVACARGFEPVAALLLQAGARVDTGNALGETPLHTAVGAGRDGLIPLLLTWAARPLALDRQQRTPAQTHAARTVRALGRMVRPESTGRDSDEERALTDAALAAWLRARGLEASRFLTASPNPWDVLQLSCAESVRARLQEGPDGLDAEDMALLDARAAALRLLCGEVAAAAQPPAAG